MGSVSLPLEDTAVISACGRYRYVLTRQVGLGTRSATFIMLNPSTADASNDDPTIRRCLGFARQWGCGRLSVLNLFAFRATAPADLKRADEPVGPENREWFERVLAESDNGLVVCGWGVHGDHMSQNRVVLGWLESLGIDPLALGVTKLGHPRHPLYVPYTALPVSLTVGRSAITASARTSASPDRRGRDRGPPPSRPRSERHHSRKVEPTWLVRSGYGPTGEGPPVAGK